MIIGGAALGAFLQANPGYMTMHVIKKSLSMFGSRFTHTFYLEVLGLIYEILNKSRREGMMAIEGDIEDAAASPIFAKYPAVLKDERMTAFICDYLRIMSSGNMAPHELEGLFDMELLQPQGRAGAPVPRGERHRRRHARFRYRRGGTGYRGDHGVPGRRRPGVHRPARGCGAGRYLLRYSGGLRLLRPAGHLAHDAKEELNLYEAIKASLVASASGMPPSLAVEFGRKVLYPAHRPSFAELEQAVRGR
jgi:chemotaxis protein MotA